MREVPELTVMCSQVTSRWCSNNRKLWLCLSWAGELLETGFQSVMTSCCFFYISICGSLSGQ